jgi:hypothetical protein
MTKAVDLPTATNQLPLTLRCIVAIRISVATGYMLLRGIAGVNVKWVQVNEVNLRLFTVTCDP